MPKAQPITVIIRHHDLFTGERLRYPLILEYKTRFGMQCNPWIVKTCDPAGRHTYFMPLHEIERMAMRTIASRKIPTQR